MLTRSMKVHAIRSETPTTVALDLIDAAEGAPLHGRVLSVPGLTPQEANAFEVHQEVGVTIAPAQA